MPHQEPAYRTAYAENGTKVCPECGDDLSQYKRLNVLAHSASHWESIPAGDGYEVPRERRAILEKIAKELGD